MNRYTIFPFETFQLLEHKIKLISEKLMDLSKHDNSETAQEAKKFLKEELRVAKFRITTIYN